MFPRFLCNTFTILCCSTALVACGGDGAVSSETPAEFSVKGVKGTISGNNVAIDLTTVEACSEVKDLTLTVSAAGATVSPDPGTVHDFSHPVVFTLTASEGGEVVVYTVTVKAVDCDGAPSGSQPTAATAKPVKCQPEPAQSTGYSEVFKGCNSKNLPVYYDRTECVRDNSTGLIWEGKPTTGLRASGNTYNNFDNTGLLQVASRFSPLAGTIPARAPTPQEVDAADNSTGFKNRVNASGLCGFSDWRVPTRDELLSIRQAGSTTLIDFLWFPNTAWDGLYATSTQYGAQEDSAWVVQFYERGANNVDHQPRDGAIFHPTLGILELRQHSVRLVR